VGRSSFLLSILINIPLLIMTILAMLYVTDYSPWLDSRQNVSADQREGGSDRETERQRERVCVRETDREAERLLPLKPPNPTP